MALYRRLESLVYNVADQTRMCTAYELLLMQLRVPREDPRTELIATKVLEAFEAGQQESHDICKYVRAKLEPPSKK